MNPLPDLATFMANIRAGGIKKTLRGHLVAAGFDRDKAEYNSMKGKVVRALGTPGGIYADMANALIFRSHTDRGDIVDLLQPMDDEHSRPSFNTSLQTRETVGALEEKDWYFTGPGGTLEALQGAEPRIAKLSRPGQKEILAPMRSLSMERDIALHRAEMLQARLDRAEKQVDALLTRLPPPKEAA